MKAILTVSQDGQQVQVVQCLRCMEVFSVAVREDELRPWDAVTALGERHKTECKNASG